MAKKASKKKVEKESINESHENQVENFINGVIKKNKKIDALINNAGIYGPKGLIENISLKDFKKTI